MHRSSHKGGEKDLAEAVVPLLLPRLPGQYLKLYCDKEQFALSGRMRQ